MKGLPLDWGPGTTASSPASRSDGKGIHRGLMRFWIPFPSLRDAGRRGMTPVVLEGPTSIGPSFYGVYCPWDELGEKNDGPVGGRHQWRIGSNPGREAAVAVNRLRTSAASPA